MPIMNGYETCSQIEDFLDTSKNLFRVNSREMPDKRRSSNSELIEFAKEIVNYPIMIAYSGLVNNEVRKKCLDAGF